MDATYTPITRLIFTSMDGYPQSRDEAENHVVRRLDSIIDLYSDFAAYAALHEKKLRTLNLINLAFLKS